MTYAKVADPPIHDDRRPMSAEVAVEAVRKKRWLVIGSVAVLLVVGGIVTGLVLQSSKPAVAKVPSEAVTTKTLTVLVTADGTTQASDSTIVYPAVGGTVKTLYVALGDTVQAGDRLFTVDDADLKTAVVQADASLAQAVQGVKQAQGTLAQANQSRAQASQSEAQAGLQQLQARQALNGLTSKPATNPVAAEQIAVAKRQIAVADAAMRSADAAATAANASISSARAGITAAQASLRSAQAARDDAVRDRASGTTDAPVDGVITTLSFAEGGTVSGASAGASTSGAQMSGSAAAGVSAASSAGSGSGAQFVISGNSQVKARVQVNESDLAKVKIGQDAIVTVDAAAGLKIPGRVSWISPNGVSTSGVVTYDVDIELLQQNDAVRPDMTATADITAAVIDGALVVPSSAIRVDGTRKYVDVVGANDATTRAYIVTGSSDASSTQVASGVKIGERVVTGRAPIAATPGGLMPGGN